MGPQECEGTLCCSKLLSIWQFVTVQQALGTNWKRSLNALRFNKGPAGVSGTCCLSVDPLSRNMACHMSDPASILQSLGYTKARVPHSTPWQRPLREDCAESASQAQLTLDPYVGLGVTSFPLRAEAGSGRCKGKEFTMLALVLFWI